MAAGPPVEAPIATQRSSPGGARRAAGRPAGGSGARRTARALATVRTVSGRLSASCCQLGVSSGLGRTSRAPRRIASKAVCIWLRLAREERTTIGVGRTAMICSVA